MLKRLLRSVSIKILDRNDHLAHRSGELQRRRPTSDRKDRTIVDGNLQLESVGKQSPRTLQTESSHSSHI